MDTDAHGKRKIKSVFICVDLWLNCVFQVHERDGGGEMVMGKKNCPICDTQAEFEQVAGVCGVRYYKCYICGDFKITTSAELSLNDPEIFNLLKGRKHLISGVLRERFDSGIVTEIGPNDFKTILNDAKAPKDPIEAVDKLVLYILNKHGSADSFFTFHPLLDYPITFSINSNEFEYYIELGKQLRYFDWQGSQEKPQLRLSIDGWERVSQMKLKERNPNKAFVAMWFDSSMNDACDAIEDALKQTQFEPPFRVDRHEHNNNINDEIIALINKSSLVVADFTGIRGGVYYEAGYAKGQNISVIFTIKEDWFDANVFTEVKSIQGQVLKESKSDKCLHFDVEHMNFIRWKNPDDLKKKLIDRIEATMPGHVRKGG